MRMLNCIVVDDEPHGLNLIKGYVEQTPFLNLIESCSNASKAIECLKSNQVDLLFLDIEMPNLTGMELAKRLVNGPSVVFTTAYDHYAVEGYQVNAIGYLLKPFSYEEFLTTTNRAYDIITSSETKEQASPKDDFIMVKADRKMTQVQLADIKFIEGVKDFVKIHLFSAEKPLMPMVSLKTMEEQLKERGFMRVHRSYVVNLNKLGIIERGQIVYGDTRITVSDIHKAKFKDFISKRSIS